MRNRLMAVGLATAAVLTAIAATIAVRRGRNGDRIPPPALPTTTSGGGDGPRRPGDLEPHPTGIFAAVGRFDYRFRRVIPVVGLVVAAGLVAWGVIGGGTLIQGGWVIDGSEEQRAEALFADRFGEQATSHDRASSPTRTVTPTRTTSSRRWPRPWRRWRTSRSSTRSHLRGRRRPVAS